MKKAVLRYAAVLGVSGLVLANHAGAATKTTPKRTATTKKTATTKAAPVTAAPVTTPAATAPARPAAPTGSVIKVGLISAETGNASSAYKNAADVARAWAKWVNEEQGGVGGHPVEIVTADNKNTAADSQAAARDLVEAKGVVALVLQDSTAESALQAYIDEKKFPVIGGSANNALAGVGHGRSLYYFMTASGGPAAAESPALIAHKLGQGPLSTAVCGEVAACAAGSVFAATKAKELGLSYAGNVPVLGSSPNYTAECLEIQSRIADKGRSAGYVSIALAPTAMSRFIRDCVRQGYQGYFGASSNTASAPILEQIENVKLGGYVNGFPWWSDAAPVKTFKAVMAKQGVKEFRDPASTSTWSALELFRKTMAKAPATVTKDDVLKAYWTIKGETLDGLLPGPVTFTEGRPSTFLQCFWPFTYVNGKFTTLELDNSKGSNGATGDLKSFCAV